MNEKEIEIAMEGLFRGASKVRARKYTKRHSGNIKGELTTNISEQICKEEKDYLKAA